MTQRTEELRLHEPSVLPLATEDGHDDLFAMNRRELLEHLPPPDEAPIVAKIAQLGIKRFQESPYVLQAPVDPVTKLIDHQAVIAQASQLVSPDYKWKAPFFDEHHLYWYANLYTTDLAMQFRELPTHKLWVPRQFHNFLHAVYAPSPVPDDDVMKASIKAFRRYDKMYEFSSQAISIKERLDSATVALGQDGQRYLMEPPAPGQYRRHRIQDPEVFERRRADFIHFIESAHRQGLIDLSQLGSIDLKDERSADYALHQIKSIMNQGLVRQKGHVAIKVAIPFERAA